MHPQARFAFVEKNGYRFTGAVIPKSGELRIALESSDAPPSAKPLRSLRRPREQRHKLLRELLLPIYPEFLKKGGDHSRFEVMRRLAPYDREFALEQIEKLQSVHNRVAVLLAAGKLDDALESAAAMPDPYASRWRTSPPLINKQTANLVILLGLYDQLPQVRRNLMEPIFAHWERFNDQNNRIYFRDYNAVFTAMALTDPQRAIRWFHGFQPKLTEKQRELVPHPWVTLADIFGHSGAELGRRVCEEVFHLWLVDKEDL